MVLVPLSLDDSDAHQKAADPTAAAFSSSATTPKASHSGASRVRPGSAPSPSLLNQSLKTYDQVVVQEAIAFAANAAEHNQDQFDPNFDFELFYNKPSEMLKRGLASRNNSVSTVVPIMPSAITSGYGLSPIPAPGVTTTATAATATVSGLNLKMPSSREESPETHTPISFAPAAQSVIASAANAAAPVRPGVGLIRQMSSNNAGAPAAAAGSQKGSLLRSSTSKSLAFLAPLDEQEELSPAAQQRERDRQAAAEEVSAFVKPLLSKMQSYKSSFSVSIVENDDKIQRVQKVKEELVQEKEEALKKRIQDREDSFILRTQQKQLQERQRAWLGLTALLSRMK